MHREPYKPSLDAMSEASETMLEPLGFAGAVPISVASGLVWAKRRQPDATSTLSDGSRSKISARDTSFAKGTYDLSRYRTEVLERSSHNDNGSHQRMHPAQHGHPIESYDAADVYHSPEAMVDFDPTEQPGVYNQVANFEFLGNRGIDA